MVMYGRKVEYQFSPDDSDDVLLIKCQAHVLVGHIEADGPRQAAVEASRAEALVLTAIWLILPDDGLPDVQAYISTGFWVGVGEV